jgi:hypothetical protein
VAHSTVASVANGAATVNKASAANLRPIAEAANIGVRQDRLGELTKKISNLKKGFE